MSGDLFNNTATFAGNTWIATTTYGVNTTGYTVVPFVTGPAPAPKKETPEEWLRRRVAEVCWTPPA